MSEAMIDAATALAANYLKVQTGDVIRFTSRAREASPAITERGAIVLLLVASRFEGMSLDDITSVLAWQKGTAVAVLRGLVCDLRLLDVSADAARPWLRNASLSVAGIALMAALNSKQEDTVR